VEAVVSEERLKMDSTADAIQLQQAGRFAEAETLYRQILEAEPDDIDALNAMGVLFMSTGRTGEGLETFNQAVKMRPDLPAPLHNLGLALASAGRLDEAIAAFNRVIELQFDYADAYAQLGSVLRRAGRMDESIAVLRRALAFQPQEPQAYCNLGNSLEAAGHSEEAKGLFEQAISLRADFAAAYVGLGNALQDLGRVDDAVRAFRQAIAIDPNLAEAHHNLGTAYGSSGNYDEAIICLKRALALQPNLAKAYFNLGKAYQETGRPREAISAWHQAVELNPNDLVSDSNRLYTLLFDPSQSSQSIRKEHDEWNRRRAVKFSLSMRPYANKPDSNRRLRIAYVSPDFRTHCQSLFMIPLLSHHDKNNFEVFCYTDVSRPDAITERLRPLADTWRSIAGMADERVAQQIRADRIDVLIDLTMHMAGGRPLMLARKPAPVQVAWLAYPGSTGSWAIDYRLTDPHLDPPGQHDDWYSEKSIRLPDTFWCFDPYGLAADRTASLPEPGQLPLENDGFVTFGCMNNFSKINEHILSLWSRVLGKLPTSRLRMLAVRGDCRQRTLDKFAAKGIAAERIDFVDFQPRPLYLEEFTKIDICLDTFPYNGHTTSLDSYWMGVPVVTLIGPTVVGRAGWSQLVNLKLTELAAKTEDEFVRLALKLADDPRGLAELRRTLRNRIASSPLMDASRFARNIENAYRAMWTQWCREQQ
jgi:protein O-GlcNAc transferase